MLESMENWQAFHKFAEVTLTSKENKEREEENLLREAQIMDNGR